jgi:hypothetical protein
LKLNNYYRVCHPTMWNFILVLKKFHQSVEDDIIDVQQGKGIHKARQVWFKAEQHTREVVRAYTTGDYIAFLKNVADTLKNFFGEFSKKTKWWFFWNTL